MQGVFVQLGCDCCALDSSMLGWRHVTPCPVMSNIKYLPSFSPLPSSLDNFLVEIAPPDMSDQTGGREQRGLQSQDLLLNIGWPLGCVSSFNSDVKLPMIFCSRLFVTKPRVSVELPPHNTQTAQMFSYSNLLTYIHPAILHYIASAALQTSWFVSQPTQSWGDVEGRIIWSLTEYQSGSQSPPQYALSCPTSDIPH